MGVSSFSMFKMEEVPQSDELRAIIEKLSTRSRMSLRPPHILPHGLRRGVRLEWLTFLVSILRP